MATRLLRFGVAKKEYWPGLLLLLLVGLFAVRHLATWPVLLRYPGEEDHVEGIPLAEMVRLRRGFQVYAPASAESFQAANYGPLYFLLGTRLVDPQKPAYFPLRLLSMLATLGCAAGCGLLAFWLSRRPLAACLGPLLFLSYPFVTRHGLSARSDLGALFLWFSGFLIAYRLRESRKLLWAVPLMVAGFFYKQQFVAAPLAVLLFLVLEKRYRLAAQFAGLLALGGIVLLGFFQFVVFRGQAFVHHLLLYNVWPFAWERALASLWFFGLLLVFPLWLGIEYLRRHRQPLLACYVGFAIVINMVLFWRIGSDTNYFLESFTVLCSLAAALFAEYLKDPIRGAKWLGLLGCSLLLSLGTTEPVPRPEDFSRDRAIQDFLCSKFAPGSTALGFYAGDLVRAGLENPITDLYAYYENLRMNRIPAEGLRTQLRRQHFAVITTYVDLRSPTKESRPDFAVIESVRDEILDHYELGATLELPRPERIRPYYRFYAWVPRQSGALNPGQSPGSTSNLKGGP